MCACPASEPVLAISGPAAGRARHRERPAVSFRHGADLTGRMQAIAYDLASSMPSYRVADYFRSKPDIVGPDSAVVLATDTETGRAEALLAATAHSLDGVRYVSLDTILVAEQHQKTPLSTRMLACLVRGMAGSSQELPAFLMLTTGNPTSYCMMSAFVRLAGARVYPTISGEQHPDDAELAATLARKHRPQFAFCKETGVLAGGAGKVPPDFYPQRPVSRHPQTNAYFSRHVGPSDRLLCLMSLPGSEARLRLWNFFIGAEGALA